MISGLLREISFCRHHVEPRVKLYMPREESYPIPLKYIDVARTTHTSLDVMMEKHIDDYWNVDGERELSDAWTGFTRFILLNERPPDGFSCSGSRLTRKQTTSRPDDVWQDIWKQMSDASKRKAKQKWAIEKPKLDDARKLRGLFFIEPTDEYFFLKKYESRPEKVGNSHASSNALQNTDTEQWRNPPQHWGKQDQTCLCCRCRRIYENTIGKCAAQVSRRSHRCKRNIFTKPLQFSAKVYTDA